MGEVEQARGERDFWRKVGKIIEPSMEIYGWNGYRSCAFRNPNMELSGIVARILIDQHDTIQRLKGG